MSRKFGKLKGRILEKFDSQKDFAEEIGKRDAFVSLYVNGKRNFTQPMIKEWSEKLEISEDKIGYYFF